MAKRTYSMDQMIRQLCHEYAVSEEDLFQQLVVNEYTRRYDVARWRELKAREKQLKELEENQ